MRIQVNKLGLTSVDYADGIEYFGARGNSYGLGRTWSQTKDHRAYVIHYCNQCGTEIYGKWLYNSLDFSPKEHNVEWERAKLNDPQKSKYIADQYALMEKAELRYFDDIRAMQNEVKEVLDLHICPCCGAILSHDDGYIAVIDGNEYSSLIEWEAVNKYAKIYDYDCFDLKETNLDSICNDMREVRLKLHQSEASKRIESTLTQYEATAPTDRISSHANILKQPEELKKYILRLIEIETTVLSLCKRLEMLYAQRIDINQKAYGSTLYILSDAKANTDAAANHLQECKNTLALLTSKVLDPIDLPMPKLPQKPREPVYEKPSLFNKKRVLDQNAALKEQFEQAYYQYENDMARYNQDLEIRKQQISLLAKQQAERHQRDIEESQNKVYEAEKKLATAKQQQENTIAISSDIATPEKAQKVLLDQEIQQAEDLLKQAVHCKYQFYNYDIIFEKYRNIVALSTIYEYLMAGRCTVLEGQSGAYNLYESESRANMIICQLNTVIESLDAIKENQYMIYSAIQKVNSNLQRLQSTMNAAAKTLSSIDATAQTMTEYMEKVAHNSDIIAHNTAVSAYYSKINAELTDSLGYMVAFS